MYMQMRFLQPNKILTFWMQLNPIFEKLLAAQTLQSTTSQRLGAFGTLLGDKAAEVTSSIASSGLGDLLQPNAASSLLSSFRSRFQ